MTDALRPKPPYSRDDPPWSHGGDPRYADWGWLFAWPAAGKAVMLSFDRAGRRHALTLFDRRDLAAEIVADGRRFSVRLAAAPGPS